MRFTSGEKTQQVLARWDHPAAVRQARPTLAGATASIVRIVTHVIAVTVHGQERGTDPFSRVSDDPELRCDIVGRCFFAVKMRQSPARERLRHCIIASTAGFRLRKDCRIKDRRHSLCERAFFRGAKDDNPNSLVVIHLRISDKPSATGRFLGTPSRPQPVLSGVLRMTARMEAIRGCCHSLSSLSFGPRKSGDRRPCCLW